MKVFRLMKQKFYVSARNFLEFYYYRLVEEKNTVIK